MENCYKKKILQISRREENRYILKNIYLCIFAQANFRVRESDITMREPDTIEFGYEGQDLSILSTQDSLTESWSLDDGERVRVGAADDGQNGGHLRTRADRPIDIASAPKRARLAEATCRSGTK